MKHSFIYNALLLGMLMLPAGAMAQDMSGKNPDAQQLFIGDNIAIAQTQYGKVKGYVLHGVYTYLGIPYGASTAGKNRFMPPQPPKPWTGIRPAVFYGDSAPQLTDGKYKNNYGTFSDHWNYYGVSEDCLMLNVWTPGTDNRRRPVLVWLHGGGYTNGNAHEQDGYNGENLSKDGDIVFVSINHRLGPIGYSDFSAVDPKFKDSGNVGMLDIHAALQWVHDNIANFGGDPGNVTVMGQSGGGAKVCNMVQMPENAGLVHKGVALSGNTYTAMDQTVSQGIGKEILKEAGLDSSQMDQLQYMPWKDYIDLANRAAETYLREHNSGMQARGAFAPVADGVHFPKGNFYTDKSAWANKVPMLFCTTTAEWSISRESQQLEDMSREQAIDLLRRPGLFGGPERTVEHATRIYDAYSKVFPNMKPVEVFDLASSNRERAIATANAKANQDAPVYLAWFGWNPPMFDGRMKAFHCSDICFWFRNTNRMITHTGGGKRPRELSNKMSSALLNFMRTGNPSTKLLPKWPVYTPEKGATMMLNDKCEVLDNPDGEARESLK